MVVYVVVPLANDAADTPNGEYAIVGSNFKARADSACDIADSLRSQGHDVIFAFGAGTDTAHAHGPTLAVICAKYVQSILSAPMVINDHDKEVFGTLSEMRWIITHVRQKYDDVIFLFVTQRRHLHRVRLMVRWFLSDVSAEYAVSKQTKEIPWWHELLAYGKLALAKFIGEDRVTRWRRRLKVKVDRA